jgi:DNA adenine methylase
MAEEDKTEHGESCSCENLELVRLEEPNRLDVVTNNFQYSCYYCNGYGTNKKEVYEHHVVSTHPKKTAYPGMADILSHGLRPQGKSWERMDHQETMLILNSVDLRGVHPFIKCAGGKRQLLPELNKMIPTQFNTYYEPFLGGGAMFFNLVSRGVLKGNAYLSDANVELINAYKVIKVNPKRVVEFLQRYDIEYKNHKPYSKEQKAYYNQLRYALNKKKFSNDVERAALFIMLNRTGFNGLWRVNQEGEFNSTPGKFKNHPLICDSSNLENVSNALRYSRAEVADYKEALRKAKKDDFIYLDPPYNPVSSTANFRGYTKYGFDKKDQSELAKIFIELDDKGCKVLLSNSDTLFIRELYSNFSGYIKEVNASRAINSKASRRKGHRELLISNYSIQ